MSEPTADLAILSHRSQFPRRTTLFRIGDAGTPPPDGAASTSTQSNGLPAPITGRHCHGVVVSERNIETGTPDSPATLALRGARLPRVMNGYGSGGHNDAGPKIPK